MENLIIYFTLYRKWLALTEVVIQLLKINQKIRSLLHAEEMIDVTLDISRANQFTDHSLQQQFVIKLDCMQVLYYLQCPPLSVVYKGTVHSFTTHPDVNRSSDQIDITAVS